MLNNIGNVYPRFTQIIGDTGTGKSCTTLRFGELITEQAKKEEIDLQHVYLNCKVDGTTRYVLFGNLVKKVNPKISTRSLSPEEMIRQLVDYLKDEGKYIIISFDEIDFFVQTNPKEHVVYDLTRVPEMYPGNPSPVIGEVFIARSLKWHDLLEPGEKSTLGLGILEFPRYTSKQITDILRERISESFNLGVVEEDTLSFISDITANPPVNGDLRVGLELLFYSGNLAENQGSMKVLPDHVRKVHGETNSNIVSEDIISLNKSEKMVLLALVRSLKINKSVYVGLRDVKQSFKEICEEFNVKPIEKFEEHMQDLIHRDLVKMKSLMEFGIPWGPLVNLEKLLNDLLK
jgi:cell division control protein 6